MSLYQDAIATVAQEWVQTIQQFLQQEFGQEANPEEVRQRFREIMAGQGTLEEFEAEFGPEATQREITLAVRRAERAG